MKALTFIAALAAMATPALAGGPTVVADDPMPEAMAAPVDAHDWSGAYVGLGYGKTSADLTYSSGATFDFNNGRVRSLFGGYLMQRGNLVFGGELAFSNTSDATLVLFPLENVNSMIDLKGKLGFAANRAMFYGTVGLSKAEYEFAVVPAQNYSASGMSYGIGMDFAVSHNFTMGIEYLARNLEGDVPGTGLSAEIDLNTVSLRAGFSF
jgi:outer membrane immunogenic protein